MAFTENHRAILGAEVEALRANRDRIFGPLSQKLANAIEALQGDHDRLVSASEPLGAWLSAALDDPNVSDAFKADINAWFAVLRLGT